METNRKARDAEEGRTLTANIQGKAQSGTSCGFCWFVVSVYPSLEGMTQRDVVTYREHLKQRHGLRAGILR